MGTTGGIAKVQPVKTGYAITPKDLTARKLLLSERVASLAEGGRLEEETEHFQVVVGRIPKRLYAGEWRETTLGDVSKEAELITGAKPLDAKWSLHQRDGANTIDAVITFPKVINRPFQLFGESAPSRPARSKAGPVQCERCHAYHDTRACRSAARCVNCGSQKENHPCRVQCTNCLGPHPADYPQCPARPVRAGGSFTKLPKASLEEIRKAGQMAFRKANTPAQEGNATQTPEGHQAAR